MYSFRCNKCGKVFEMDFPATVNAANNPELKEKILSGELFLHQCPHCGDTNIVSANMLYIDPEAGFLVCLSGSSLSSTGEVPGYVCRLVSSVGDLIEKIKIFDAGLDDVAVEICKFVTLRETGKDVDLRFYRMDGPDNELILTYPQNGRMEMLSIGLNVYEDSRGIISRNPVLRRESEGLVRVDAEWLRRFIG